MEIEPSTKIFFFLRKVFAFSENYSYKPWCKQYLFISVVVDLAYLFTFRSLFVVVDGLFYVFRPNVSWKKHVD